MLHRPRLPQLLAVMRPRSCALVALVLVALVAAALAWGALYGGDRWTYAP